MRGCVSGNWEGVLEVEEEWACDLDRFRRLVCQRGGGELHRGGAHERFELLVPFHRKLLLQQRQLLFTMSCRYTVTV